MCVNRIPFIKLLTWIGLALLTMACQAEAPKQVELIVPLSDMSGTNALWSLSPQRDKIGFRGQGRDRILFLTTGEQVEIQKACSNFDWLDNDHILCSGNSVFITNSRLEILLTAVTANEVEVEALLLTAKAIYRPESRAIGLSRDRHQSLILELRDEADTPQFYEIRDIADPDTVLRGHDVIMFPAETDQSTSPNGAYYYQEDGYRKGYSLRIYDAQTDTELVAVPGREPSSPEQYVIGGWAADSSGVYFQVTSGLFADGKWLDKHGINKLQLP